MTVIVAQMFLGMVLLLSVVGFFGYHRRYFELASHFKLQYLMVSLFCFCVFLVNQAWFWAISSMMVTILNLIVLLPWYFPQNSEFSDLPTTRLKLLFANVDYENTNYPRFIDVVNEVKPDILIAQEVTYTWADQLTVLKEQFPYERTVPQRGGWGLALYSRVPIEHSDVVFLGSDRRPGIQARLDLGRTALWLLTVHPRAPLRRDYFYHRNEQLCEASALIRRLPTPKVLVGDLNTSLWSPHFVHLLRETGLLSTRQGFGLLPTWPAHLPWWPWLMIPIDHCLVSQDIRVVNCSVGPHMGSDHLPLIVDLDIPEAPGHRMPA